MARIKLATLLSPQILNIKMKKYERNGMVAVLHSPYGWSTQPQRLKRDVNQEFIIDTYKTDYTKTINNAQGYYCHYNDKYVEPQAEEVPVYYDICWNLLFHYELCEAIDNDDIGKIKNIFENLFDRGENILVPSLCWFPKGEAIQITINEDGDEIIKRSNTIFL